MTDHNDQQTSTTDDKNTSTTEKSTEQIPQPVEKQPMLMQEQRRETEPEDNIQTQSSNHNQPPHQGAEQQTDPQQNQRQGEEGDEEGVFSNWGFGTNVVNSAVTSNMSTFSSLLSSTGDSVGNLLNAPTSFFTSSDNTTTSTTNDSTAPDALPHNSDVIADGNFDNTKNTVNSSNNTDNINGMTNKEIEDEDLGVAASNLANVATAELEQASRAAQETIGKAAQEIGRGWGTLNSFLDDMLAPEVGNSNNHTNDSNSNSNNLNGKEEDNIGLELLGTSGKDKDVNEIFKELFPHLEEKESDSNKNEGENEVVDHYKCTLIQKYRCYLNNSTPEKAFPLKGRLFVTMSDIAMYITDDNNAFGGNSFGINIPFDQVIKIQKGAKSMLRVVTRSQTSFIFAEFDSETHYQGALSLLEQLGAAAAGVPPPSIPSNPAPTPTAPAEQVKADVSTAADTATASVFKEGAVGS